MNENRFYSSRYNFRFQKLAFLKSKITRIDGGAVLVLQFSIQFYISKISIFKI